MGTEKVLGMSDEDFLKMNSAADLGASSASTSAVIEPPADTPVDPPVEDVTPTPDLTAETKSQEDEDKDPSGSDPAPKADDEPDATKKAQAPDAVVQKEEPKPEPAPGEAPKDVSKEEPKGASKDTPKEELKPVDYEAFFKQVMTPFKANGRMVELQTPEEAIRLMQMGAGFGRKLQDIQPHLKTLRMLEKHDLLDEGKLSFLIDIQNKNPEAIKKLIKESGIDPLDINTQDNPNYVPQNHSVSDAEVAFHDAVAEVQSQPNGKETIQLINQTWDQTSKAALWESPEILGVIQSQRENGIYDQIVAEIDRQKLLGTIPTNSAFLPAYKIAGDALVARGGFKPPPGKDPNLSSAPAAVNPPQVLAVRTDTPKPKVENTDKAAATAPSPTTPRKATTLKNPLEMADDEFLKQFAGRI